MVLFHNNIVTVEPPLSALDQKKCLLEIVVHQMEVTDAVVACG